jgi:hypothetical protein
MIVQGKFVPVEYSELNLLCRINESEREVSSQTGFNECRVRNALLNEMTTNIPTSSGH